jgi:hypothetical protein
LDLGFGKSKVELDKRRNVMISTVRSGRWERLFWLMTKGFKISEEVLVCAAVDGRLDILMMLNEVGHPPTHNVAIGATKKGHMIILQWFVNSNFKLRMKDIEIDLIKDGNLVILNWLYEKGYPPGFWSWGAAARFNHMDIASSHRRQHCVWVGWHQQNR